MNRNARIFCLLVLTLAMLSACSSKPSANEAQKGAPPETIQGKAQVLIETGGGANEAALNAGGPSVYIWQGARRYRLFFRTKTEITHGDEYIVDGVNAQRVIDEMGDPDNGANGYPLRPSCERVVRMVWPGMALDALDLNAEVLRARVKRYPARPVFLVSRIRSAKSAEGGEAKKKDTEAEEKKIPEVEVAADKQRALLAEGSPVLPAPLWEPKGGTTRCAVAIGPDGKISQLETGAQLCEFVDWSKFRYQPTARAGRPVKVKTEVEVRFEPRK